jgi:hypothetical protein
MDTGTKSPITPASRSTAPTNRINRRTVTLELLFHSGTTSADIPAPNDAKLNAYVDAQGRSTARWLVLEHENDGARVTR